jgi:superfamily II DNA or RNA helicase
LAEFTIFQGSPFLYGVARESEQFGLPELDLISSPSRFFTGLDNPPPSTHRSLDPRDLSFPAGPSQLLSSPTENWQPMSRRSVARLFAWFLVTEDPQRRLESREVQTLAHQASLVRYVLEDPNLSRVLIGDEVGLGKTIEAALIVKELINARPGMRILYLAPARLVANVSKEFTRMNLGFRRWVAGEENDGNMATDGRLIASIHKAAFPTNLKEVVATKPWDLLIVDECHHLSAYGDDDAKKKVKQYALVDELVKKLPDGGRLILMSGTPHQGNASRFKNLLELLRGPSESQDAVSGRVIYRTKEDVRGWHDEPLFPLREVKPAKVIPPNNEYQSWLTEIHRFYSTGGGDGPEAIQRAADWRCGQALQWAASSVQAGLGYLIRQAIRAGWTLSSPGLISALSAVRPYRRGKPDEDLQSLFERMKKETGAGNAAALEDIEEDEEPVGWKPDPDRLASLLEHGILLLRSVGDSKWHFVSEKILDEAPEDQFVLFAQPIETVTALASFLKRTYGTEPALVLGGQSDEERSAEVQRFWNGETRFLVSSRAGNEGINLQCAHRLIHVDVPWNPMDLEQRVGRVHRFGSKRTIVVDTVILQGSREEHVYNTAKEKLRAITSDMTPDPAKFEELFARVMNLVPPAELHTILSDEAYGPLNDSDSLKLAGMIEAGLNSWNSFHKKFHGEHKIAQADPGQTTWEDLRLFATQYAKGKAVSGFRGLSFERLDKKAIVSRERDLEVLELSDGTLMACGDVGGMPIQGSSKSKVVAGGLNIPTIAETLRSVAFPDLPTGAAYLRYSEETKDGAFLRPAGSLGIFVGARLSLRQSQAAGWQEGLTELHVWTVDEHEIVTKLSPPAAASLLREIFVATLRTKEISAPKITEALLLLETKELPKLKRPSLIERTSRFSFATVPLFAGVIAS